jgi:AcrR family transcriptional regulator
MPSSTPPPSFCSSKASGAVSMDAVAERAGVSKATIYRWWPTKETLALDALYQEWAAASQLLTQRPGPRSARRTRP